MIPKAFPQEDCFISKKQILDVHERAALFALHVEGRIKSCGGGDSTLRYFPF